MHMAASRNFTRFMKDRIGELQAGTEAVQVKKVVKKKKEEDNTASTMNVFFQQLADIKDDISRVKTYIEDIQNIHNNALNNVISEQQNAGI
jgi:t-SNARE complex subunit (syntaxin)